MTGARGKNGNVSTPERDFMTVRPTKHQPRRSDVADQDLSCRQTDARLERRRIACRRVEPLKGTLGRQSCFAGLGGM